MRNFLKKQEEAAEPSASEESSEAERMKAPDFTYDERRKTSILETCLDLSWRLARWKCRYFHEKYLESGEEIQFLMINMTDGSRETKETAVGFIEKKQYEFPVFFDTEF